MGMETAILVVLFILFGLCLGMLLSFYLSKEKELPIMYEQSLKVHNAKICINCDEIHHYDVCPKCLSPYFFQLTSSDIKSINMSWAESLKQAKEAKDADKTSIGIYKKKYPVKKAVVVHDDVFAPVNEKLSKRKRTAISCSEGIGISGCVTA